MSSFVSPENSFPKRGGINFRATKDAGVITIVLVVNYFPPHGRLIKMVSVYPGSKETEV